MAGYLLPVAFVLGLGALLFKKDEKGGVSETERDTYLSRMGNTRAAGQPISHVPAGTTIYQWAWGAKAGEPTALEFITHSVKNGWVVWADLTLLSQERFYLALAKPGVVPQGTWFILAQKESDLSRVPPLTAFPGESKPRPPSGVTVPVPLPADAVPVSSPADAAKIPGVPGASVSQAAPAPPANTTGLPEIDRVMASPDATPYQLRQIAAELARTGKADAAAVVERRASDLYASLRAAHAAQGGTPFNIKDHHGGGVTGHLPSNVAKHYGGTLSELGKANPGKRQWDDWKVGSTWLLPLSWDAEAKAPPPIAGMPKKPATALKPAKAGKVKRA